MDRLMSRKYEAVSRLFEIVPATKYAQIESRDSWRRDKEQNAGVAGTTQSIYDEVPAPNSGHDLAIFGGQSNREGTVIDAAKSAAEIFQQPHRQGGSHPVPRRRQGRKTS